MVIEVENLVKCYGEIRAVDDISFHVGRGEVFGLLGPNGAGKTTTAEIIEGIRPADSGRVFVLGMDVAKVPEKIKEKIGIQLQAPSLLPQLKVKELLETFCGFYQRHLPIGKLLEMLSLQESRKVLVKNLSGGQQQRLSVAMALINDPEIAFLDEPTSGLDPQARRSLWSVIENMGRQGKTVFLTTHYMEEAELLCDRVAIIDHGKIIAMDTPQRLIRDHFEEKAIQFDIEEPPDSVVLQGLPKVTNVAVDNGEVIIYTGDVPATMSALLHFADGAGLSEKLKDLRVREASLEDVFLKLTGRKLRE